MRACFERECLRGSGADEKHVGYDGTCTHHSGGVAPLLPREVDLVAQRLKLLGGAEIAACADGVPSFGFRGTGAGGEAVGRGGCGSVHDLSVYISSYCVASGVC